MAASVVEDKLEALLDMGTNDPGEVIHLFPCHWQTKKIKAGTLAYCGMTRYTGDVKTGGKARQCKKCLKAQGRKRNGRIY